MLRDMDGGLHPRKTRSLSESLPKYEEVGRTTQSSRTRIFVSIKPEALSAGLRLQSVLYSPPADSGLEGCESGGLNAPPVAAKFPVTPLNPWAAFQSN